MRPCSVLSACSGPSPRWPWPAPRFQLSQTGIAIFALAGMAGAVASPVAGRLNGLYLALFFAGGALGSALGGWVLAARGWEAALLAGLLLPALALAYWASEYAMEMRAAPRALSRP